MRISKSFAVVLLAVMLVSARTGKIVISQPEDFQAGKFKAAELSSLGKVTSGKAVKEIPVDAVMVSALFELGPDSALVGTGGKAALYRYSGGKLELIFRDPEKERLAVTDIAAGKDDLVYFSLIPKPAIYKMQGTEVKKFSEPDAPYIWTLLPLVNGNLLAGGGPKASVFLVKADGKADKIVSFDAEQVMEIIDAGKGEYIAATSRPGLAVSFKLDGTYRVLHAFQQEEVIAVRKLSDQSLLIAVNQGAAPPSPVMAQPQEQAAPGPPPRMEIKESQDPELEQMDEEVGPPPSMPAKPPSGRATVFQLFPDKGLKQILTLKQAVIFSAAGDEENGFYLGTDDQGRVYRIFPGGEEVRLSFDLQSGRVVSFGERDGEVDFIGAAQPGRLYKIEKTSVKAGYESDVLDAQFAANWGKLEWAGKGKVKFETRSGNVPKPDDSWSRWQEVASGNPGPIQSPRARFIQFRAEWTAADVEINRVEINYRALNQAEYITQMTVTPAVQPRGQDQGQPGAKNQKPPASPIRRGQINWRIENPDQDDLFLQLYYKESKERLWTLIAEGEDVKGNSYQFDAAQLPDGLYRVKLAVSDWPANPENEVFQAEKISEPFLVDSTKPSLTLKVSDKGVVSGQVEDATSAISSMEYFVDDGDAKPVLSLDGVLDEKVEGFSFTLKNLDQGWHKITMRACDQADNCQLSSQEFQIK